MLDSAIAAIHGKFVFDRRTRVLADHFVKLLPSGSVLDVGCGDGTIDALVCSARPDLSVRGVDILVRPTTKIPVERYDGRTLPTADKSVDVVLFVDVLHHTNDPKVLLREARRVARKRVMIKDHTADGVLPYATLRLMDWVGNAHHGVALPYNYWPEKTWRSAFDELGLSIETWNQHLGLYPFPMSLAFERRLHFIATLLPS